MSHVLSDRELKIGLSAITQFRRELARHILEEVADRIAITMTYDEKKKKQVLTAVFHVPDIEDIASLPPADLEDLKFTPDPPPFGVEDRSVKLADYYGNMMAKTLSAQIDKELIQQAIDGGLRYSPPPPPPNWQGIAPQLGSMVNGVHDDLYNAATTSVATQKKR